jgi:acetyl esterase
MLIRTRPPVELYAWYRSNYGKGENSADPRLSPLHADDLRGLPAAIILYCGFDPLRDEAASYAMKLAKADVAVKTLYFADMIHGFLTMGGIIPAVDTAIASISELMRT